MAAWGLSALLTSGCVASQTVSSSASGPIQGSSPATTSTPEPASPSPAQSVVPWVDRPAPSYLPPSASLPPADARPCLPADLRAEAGQVGFGLGNSNLPVTFVNASTTPCTLIGYPTLVGIDADGTARPIAARHGSYFGDPGPPANIAPGGSAALNISGADACQSALSGEHKTYKVLRVGLPAGGSVEVAGSEFDTACGVTVSPFGVPATANPPLDVPLSPLTATIAAPRSVGAGTTLRYVVTVMNPTDTEYSLVPCPAYEQFVGSGSGEPWVATIREGYLNCDAVSAIPARRSVSFEMRLAIPADQPAGEAKFGWHLQGEQGPWANAPLLVQAAQ
jgi:hypothetical protein